MLLPVNFDGQTFFISFVLICILWNVTEQTQKPTLINNTHHITKQNRNVKCVMVHNKKKIIIFINLSLYNTISPIVSFKTVFYFNTFVRSEKFLESSNDK